MLVKEIETAPKKGRVEIEFEPKDGALPAILSGVESEELERLLAPFWRTDDGRTAAENTGNDCGLNQHLRQQVPDDHIRLQRIERKR